MRTTSYAYGTCARIMCVGVKNALTITHTLLTERGTEGGGGFGVVYEGVWIVSCVRIYMCVCVKDGVDELVGFMMLLKI